jgi:hypothetical protein
LGEFARQCNVSSRSLAESSAIRFIRSILDIGMSLGRACPTITSELLLPNISTKKVSGEIQSSGEARGADILGRYQARRFANLVCDAGTVQRLHTLYALVTSPDREAPPLVANIVDSGGFDGDDDARFFASSLCSQFADGLVICGCIIDNLAAQSLGLRRTLESSENCTLQAVLHVPCFCHAISLVFVNSIRDCPALRQAIEGIGRWEAVLRTRFARGVMTGTRRCASIPKT